jgi:hypothetical protein
MWVKCDARDCSERRDAVDQPSSCRNVPDRFLELPNGMFAKASKRVLRQMELIAKLELAGRRDTARMARELLATLTTRFTPPAPILLGNASDWLCNKASSHLAQ